MTTQRGFTLIEMAIVLVIITILIGGLAMPLAAQIKARRIAETRADMQTIHDALIGYAMSHYVAISPPACTCSYDSSGAYLSSTCDAIELCPASTSTSPTGISFSPSRHYLPCPDTANGGTEGPRDSTGNCTQTRGGLPWITLGVKGQDAWGNRYTYAVTPAFGNNKIGFTSMSPAPPIPPTNPSAGNLNIYPNNTCGTPSAAKDIPVIVVSHGPNGRGARNVNFVSGTPTPAPPSDTSKDELQNLNRAVSLLPCGNDTQFVSANPSDAFDDLLTWVSGNELFNRVCLSGGCP